MPNPKQFDPIAKALSELQGDGDEPMRFDVTLTSGREVSILDRSQYEALRDAASELEQLKADGRILPEPPVTPEDEDMIAQMMRDD